MFPTNFCMNLYNFSDNILRGDIYPKPSTTLTYFTSVPDYPVGQRLSALQHQLHITTTTPFDQTTSTGPWSNLVIPYHHTQPLNGIKNEEEDVIVTSEESEEKHNEEVKKRNPYSIEELLKKPESNKNRRIQAEFSDVRQPVGMLVENNSVLEVEKTDE